MASLEQELIRRLFAPLAAREPGAYGLRDDAASMRLDPDEDLVVTKDALIAGVHFFEDDPPDAIARKALRVNVSDLVAKGAEPRSYLLAVALPRALPEKWLETFVTGLARDQEEFGCILIGGDTVSTPGPLTLSVTALGAVPRGGMVHRHGAKIGDAVYVTGSIGDAALHVGIVEGRVAAEHLDDAGRAHLRARYELPLPRVSLAAALREHAHAAMDISDGLAGDLAMLCEASSVGAEVDIASIPFSEPASVLVADGDDVMACAIAGGDDYEILCCIPDDERDHFVDAAGTLGVPVTRIGKIVEAADGVVLRRADGSPFVLEHASFSHL